MELIAAVPQWIVDLGISAGVFTAVAGAIVILWRTPPVQLLRRGFGWVFDIFIGTPFRTIASRLGAWFEERVQAANKEHVEYVRYHLGPNGTTKPVHQRLTDVERAVTTPALPFIDWDGPLDTASNHEEPDV